MRTEAWGELDKLRVAAAAANPHQSQLTDRPPDLSLAGWLQPGGQDPADSVSRLADAIRLLLELDLALELEREIEGDKRRLGTPLSVTRFWQIRGLGWLPHPFGDLQLK